MARQAPSVGSHCKEVSTAQHDALQFGGRCSLASARTRQGFSPAVGKRPNYLVLSLRNSLASCVRIASRAARSMIDIPAFNSAVCQRSSDSRAGSSSSLLGSIRKPSPERCSTCPRDVIRQSALKLSEEFCIVIEPFRIRLGLGAHCAAMQPRIQATAET
jgi:hypothetical protein